MKQHPLNIARRVCDTLIEKYQPNELEPVRRPWSYAHGLFMCGLQNLFEETKDIKYLEYTKHWADCKIDENGEFYFKDACIEGSDQPCLSLQLDTVQPGVPLFVLYKAYSDERYRCAIESLYELLEGAYTTSDGGYFHYWQTNRYAFQMWLDGLYMAEPFTMQYYLLTGKEECLDMVWRQVRVMTEHTFDEKTGLLYHAWDESKAAEWADRETGRSEEFWARSIGWYCVALVDILEHFPKERSEYKQMKQILVNVVTAVLSYQDKSGLWYQVMDKVEKADNWLESSSTCLFLYTISKSIRLGFLPKDYKRQAHLAYQGIISMLKEDNNCILLENISRGLNVGDYKHYVQAQKKNWDLHGFGTLVLSFTEYSKVL